MIIDSNRKLIERVLDSLDWDYIYKSYKHLKKALGSESLKIKGVRKLKKGEKLTPILIREEVKCVFEYIIENDLPEFFYGFWIIYWVNGEWELESEDEENEDGESIYIPIVDSKLEVLFTPIRLTGIEKIEKTEENNVVSNIEVVTEKDLELKLQKALAEEDYELATKMRDLISECKRSIKKNG